MPEVLLPRAYCYKLAPEMNRSKRAALEAVQAEWARTLPRAFAWFWKPFLRGGQLPRNPARSGPASTFPATALVTSQKDLMAGAIEGQAKSWASNLKQRIARAVMSSPALAANPGLRRQLLWVNAMRAWLLPYPKQLELLRAQPSKDNALLELSPAAARWMRKLVRRYIETHRLPDPMQLPLQVNQLSATLASRQKTKAFWADRWLRMSTLGRGQRIELPVMANPFADAKGGRLATTFPLIQREGDWYLLGTRYLTPTPWPEHRTEVLAIDLGLRNLMVSSEGDVYGRDFLDELKRRDAHLLKLQQGLQGAGIRRLSECRRYRLFVARLRGWLKTTLQTALARLLALRRPKKVVIEDLLFSGQRGELSRRMNRLLRRFGQRYFSQTLEERQVELGFELERVNPAYSSQTCSSCGFVHPKNRDGNRFRCLSCGRRAHADANAARNLAGRSGQGSHPPHADRQTLRARALGEWAARLRGTLTRDTLGPMRRLRAAACARAGLAALQTKKGPTERSGLESLAEALDLLNGRSCETVPIRKIRTTGSTRKSE